MPPLTSLSVTGLADLLDRRGASSVEVLEAYLQAIDRLDPSLGAYLWLDRDGARAQAFRADALRAKGASCADHPLLGVPLAVKDMFNVLGQPMTCGSRMLASFVSPYESAVTARLKAAGAVLLGKTNLDEFAMGSSTENSTLKTTHNPWNTAHAPGGSSGGSAAAVAAHLAAAALGTDTGGSIRQPAACCGVVGLKPTYGRVSRYGMVAFASSLDHAGPITRSVEDAALLLQVIAGHDPRDATSSRQPPSEYVAALSLSIEGLTVGLPREYFGDGLHPDVERAVRAAASTLQSLGVRLRDVSLPHTRFATPTYYLLCTSEASSNLARFDGLRFGNPDPDPDLDLASAYRRVRGQGFGPEVKRRIMLGTYALGDGYFDAYYGRAQKVRTLIRRDFCDAFGHCDLLLTPTSPTTAPKLGALTQDPLQMYLSDVLTIGCNLAGLPSLSLPCGLAPDGLPIGLQLIAPHFAEDRLLALAHAFERAQGALPLPPVCATPP